MATIIQTKHTKTQSFHCPHHFNRMSMFLPIAATFRTTNISSKNKRQILIENRFRALNMLQIVGFQLLYRHLLKLLKIRIPSIFLGWDVRTNLKRLRLCQAFGQKLKILLNMSLVKAVRVEKNQKLLNLRKSQVHIFYDHLKGRYAVQLRILHHH